MKKIGVITHYFGSKNYGGLLQAYALCKFLNERGCYAEQISYDSSYKKSNKSLRLLSINEIKDRIKSIIAPVCYKFSDYKIKSSLLQREKAISIFRTAIPHSKTIYNDITIEKSNEEYDIFITGSDQVWNIDWYHPPYFLDFVSPKNKKISYAASISKERLTMSQISLFKRSLSDYNAISVREESSVALLENVIKMPITYCLDPTLLLSEFQWNDICSKCLCQEDYIFCYFLGKNLVARKLAMEYAIRHNLKIITLPHLSGHYRRCDAGFGDIQLYDISPGQFISLVRYSKFVFTDSFHAIVFSHIYKREFVVFSRNAISPMNTRISCITKLFHTEDRYCDTEEKLSIAYIESLEKIDYSKNQIDYIKKREESISFIDDVLNL